jgi:hypothetical protein
LSNIEPGPAALRREATDEGGVSSLKEVGLSSLKEVGLSSGFSRFFFCICPGSGRTLYAEALGSFVIVVFRTRG